MSAREITRATEGPSRNSIVRRIVNLPMSIIGGVTRAMSGMSLTRALRRSQRVPFQQPQEALLVPDEWVFLRSFELQYGLFHPFFYACRFAEALKMAEEDSKLLFLYLHSQEHPFTAKFCSETLCSELVVQFLDANFISWGALTSSGEGFQMARALHAESFPFCAIVFPAPGNSLVVLQQVEGPVSRNELVEILQRTTEEQGLAFKSTKAAEAEMRSTYTQIRGEQDAAYHAALQIDKENDRTRDLEKAAAVQIQMPAEAKKRANIEKPKRNQATMKQRGSKATEIIKETQRNEANNHRKDHSVTQIQIRFPNGERKEQSFLCSDKVQSLYRYIDSLDLPGIGGYRLVSNFPRRVYGIEQMGMTLKDAGLHPRASLFLELVP